MTRFEFRPTVLAIPLLMAGLAVAGCFEDERANTAGLEVIARWAELGPEVGTSLDDAIQDRVTLDWRFRTPEEIAQWEGFGFDLAYEPTGEGLYLRSSGVDPRLERETDFDASSVDVIRVHHSGLNGSNLQFFWAREGELFVEERSMRVWTHDPGGALSPFYTLRLHEHPEWTGRIHRVRIDPTERPSGRVELLGVFGSNREIPQEDLSRITGSATRVDLPGESRLALLSPPGRTIRKRVSIPKGARLRGGLALPFDSGPEVTFQILATDGQGEPTVLQELSLDPESEGKRWFDWDLDLTELAGRDDIEIGLQTVAKEYLDPLLGLPVWSAPILVAPRTSSEAPPNLVLIVIDTLRSDRLSLYGHQNQTSPHLDAWASRRAVVFENAIAPSPWTLPSHVSMFTGLDAMTHGVNYTHPTPAGLTLLAERLRSAGYSTAAVTGGAFLHPQYGLDQGFDQYRYWQAVGPFDVGRDLAAGVETSLRWIKDLPRPFFLFLHTYEVHSPYQASDPWFSEFADGRWPAELPLPAFRTASAAPDPDVGWRFDASIVEQRPDGDQVSIEDSDGFDLVRASYDSGIARADQFLAPLFQALETDSLHKETMTILTSDHGEALGEKGRGGHAFLWDFNLKVPLLLALPDGTGAGHRIDRQVRLVDVVPTVLSALGLPQVGEVDGRSVLPLIGNPRADFPEIAESYAGSSNYGLSLRYGNRWKYIYQHAAWQPIHGEKELYDLVADPAEELNLSLQDSRRSKSFDLELMRRFLSSSSNLRFSYRNHGNAPLRSVIRGPLSHAFTVKGFHLPEGLAEWTKGETRLVLAPGEEAEIFLEGEAVGQVSLALAVPGTGGGPSIRFQEVLSVPELVDPIGLCLGGREWLRCEEPPPGTTGVVVGWHGEIRAVSASASRADRALKEQMRALGYL